MGRKKNLRARLRKQGLDDRETPTLVVCTGKKCAPREESAKLVADLEREIAGLAPRVRLVTVGCLDVCKKGPIAATYPKIRIKKRVTLARARKLLAKLTRMS